MVDVVVLITSSEREEKESEYNTSRNTGPDSLCLHMKSNYEWIKCMTSFFNQRRVRGGKHFRVPVLETLTPRHPTALSLIILL